MNPEWKKDTLKIIEGIFRDQFFDESIRIDEATSPAEIAEWDSLAQINLLTAVEHTFRVQFTAEEMAEIDSVGKLLLVLSERQAA